LQHIYGDLLPEKKALAANILQIGQAQFLPFGYTAATASIGANAYYYMPSSGCTTEVPCKIHISFHGCVQTIADIGTKYVEYTGFNSWAEANNIIVIYPQAVKSFFMPSNPNGCWDWWGYINGNYATNKGVQMVMVHNLVEHFKSNYVIE